MKVEYLRSVLMVPGCKYVCMYMCIYIYIHIYIYIYIYSPWDTPQTRITVSTTACILQRLWLGCCKRLTEIGMRLHTASYGFLRLLSVLRTHTYVVLYICMHVYMDGCMHACMYV